MHAHDMGLSFVAPFHSTVSFHFFLPSGYFSPNLLGCATFLLPCAPLTYLNFCLHSGTAVSRSYQMVPFLVGFLLVSGNSLMPLYVSHSFLHFSHSHMDDLLGQKGGRILAQPLSRILYWGSCLHSRPPVPVLAYLASHIICLAWI